MTFDTIREYCLAKEGVEECFPFDEDTLVFKVKGKMFLLMSITEQPVSINVKCDPDKALELRAAYEHIRAGYHMNKKHWNTITIDRSIPRKVLLEQIDHSYELVANGGRKPKNR